jgi:hypothetical protein
MARREDQAEKVVADFIVESLRVDGHGVLLLLLEFAAEFAVLAIEERTAADQIDRAMLRRGHQPRARIRWNARRRPLFERGYKRVVRKIFCGADVVRDARESGD